MTEESSYVQYVVVDDDGLILRTGTSKSIDIEYITTTPAEHVILDNVPPDNNYRWDGTEWISIPVRPNNPVNFDVITNTWKDLRNLEDFKRLKWEELKLKRTELENAGFTWNGLVFDSDQKSQLYLSNALELAQISGKNIEWILKDNSVASLTAENLLSIKLSLSEYINNIYNTSQTLRNQLDLADSIEKVNSIVWPV